MKADAPIVPEHTLLSQLRDDPSGALPAIVEMYERPLLRHASAVLMDRGAAEDVVQESFLKLLANGQAIDNLGGWLHRVTHNLALDHLRREGRLRKLHARAVSDEVPQVDGADRELLSREAVRRVEEELARLTANERAVLFLKMKEGRSYKEISAATGLSVSNVGYLIHHGLRKLSERMREAK